MEHYFCHLYKKKIYLEENANNILVNGFHEVCVIRCVLYTMLNGGGVAAAAVWIRHNINTTFVMKMKIRHGGSDIKSCIKFIHQKQWIVVCSDRFSLLSTIDAQKVC